MTASQLLSHSWIRGEDVPEKPLPDTAERLRAFKTASTAIHGSLLMAALLHQDSLKASQGAQGEGALKRTFTEGVGMLQPGSTFNVVRAAYNMFDPDNKGHITAADLRRVCAQLGYPVDERDLDNMLSVLAPSAQGDDTVRASPAEHRSPCVLRPQSPHGGLRAVWPS